MALLLIFVIFLAAIAADWYFNLRGQSSMPERERVIRQRSGGDPD